MTATTLIATASISVFLVVFWLASVAPIARIAVATTRSAVLSMNDPDIDELARECAVQKAALRLVVTSGSLILRSLLALAAASVPILVADWAEITPQTATLSFMERWDVILVATAVVTLGYVVCVRKWSR